MDIFLTWWYLTTFILLIESYRDWKTTKIDERHIYLIFGYTLFLGVSVGTSIWEVFGFMIAAGVILATARNVLARGDQMVLFALLFGHYKAGTLIWFILSFIGGLTTYFIGKRIKKTNAKAPALPMITLAHILTLPLFF